MGSEKEIIMTDFVSSVKVIDSPINAVFDTLSDWSRLESIKDKLPQDKVKHFECDSHSCRFQVDMAGEIAVRIVEREPFKTIKMESEKSPIVFTAWIQLKEKDMTSCYVKLTLRADIPFMLKGMLSKPLEQGIEKAAEALASYSY